jgi:hypothetical protein
MKSKLRVVLVLAGIGLLAGCSSSDSNSTSGGAGGSDPIAYEPAQSGIPMDETEACKTVTDAMSAAAVKLGCTITLPTTCPDYVRATQEPACSQWDQGTIQGCATYYGTYTSCDDFKNHPCHIAPIASSAPNGCPADAGAADSQADVAEDVGQADANDGGMKDSGNDTGVAKDSGEADAGADAKPSDSGVDGSSDSSADALGE